jgi:membrane-associated phospholipid phosphatase
MVMDKALALKRCLVFMLVLGILFAGISPLRLFCGEETTFDYRLNQEFFSGFGNDIYEVFRAPGRWESDDWWGLTGVLGTGVLLYAFDQKIHDWSQEHLTQKSEDWARVGSTFGDGLFLGGLITSLYLGGEVFDEKSLRKTALLGLESWLTAGAVVLGLKAVIGRARPYIGLGARHFEPFSFSSGNYSFPSGHAVSAFAVATVVADQTDFILADVLAYTLSAWTAISRVHESEHWASDVFLGAAIGYFIGKKICSLHRSENQPDTQVGFSLNPGAKGLTITLSF